MKNPCSIFKNKVKIYFSNMEISICFSYMILCVLWLSNHSACTIIKDHSNQVWKETHKREPQSTLLLPGSKICIVVVALLHSSGNRELIFLSAINGPTFLVVWWAINGTCKHVIKASQSEYFISMDIVIGLIMNRWLKIIQALQITDIWKRGRGGDVFPSLFVFFFDSQAIVI